MSIKISPPAISIINVQLKFTKVKKWFNIFKLTLCAVILGAILVSCDTKTVEQQKQPSGEQTANQQVSTSQQLQADAARQQQTRFMEMFDSLTPSQKNSFFIGVKHIMEPQPAKVEPGRLNSDPPSDAIILFDGKNLSEWEENPRRRAIDGPANTPSGPTPPTWVIKDGGMRPTTASGTIQTKRLFKDFQLHIEWKTPTGLDATVTGQSRGNSGVIIQGLYEVQVLDSYSNTTYVNGQAGAVYMQYPPLVNPARKEGVWQTYDIIYTAPRFKDSVTYFTPPRITLIYNGVLVQNNVSVQGPTVSPGIPQYAIKEHGDGPIQLQQHGNPTTFRNIWIREL